MNYDVVYVAKQALILSLLLSLPIVLVTSAVGLLFSIFQALTQIQDQTLQFLVKLVAVSVTLVISYHWMGRVLMSYTLRSFEQMSRMGVSM